MSKAYMPLLDLGYLNLFSENAFYQLDAASLIEYALINKEGELADSGALVVDTGKFTGRSPKDRFIVYDKLTQDTVWWGDVNIKFDAEKFEMLQEKMVSHINKAAFYVRDAYACVESTYKLSIRVITETAYQNLFANNLFLRPFLPVASDNPEWTIIASPSFLAEPDMDGTRQPNFSIINFSARTILIGGTGYTGEIKKAIFSVLNYILPLEKKTLSMHCSANIGAQGDTAVFFGLSGTGKTTLSADPERRLIGDDEHGWGRDSVFNFEGGCYAKCVGLTAENEPEIFQAVKFGALLENTNFFPGTRQVNFSDISKTENTRVAYPIHYIKNAAVPSSGAAPQHIFFLTADAFGVLPPISKLNTAQAMFHFLSGYTAKIAGTEAGISEPQVTFSACFGKAFLPLHPTFYAALLGEKLKAHKVNVWLVNTGWSGGPYSVGKRINLSYTRAMVSAALNGELDEQDFITEPFFGLSIPLRCANVPSEILNPKDTWKDKDEYLRTAMELREAFRINFAQFEDFANDEIRSAVPKASEIIT